MYKNVVCLFKKVNFKILLNVLIKNIIKSLWLHKLCLLIWKSCSDYSKEYGHSGKSECDNRCLGIVNFSCCGHTPACNLEHEGTSI